MTFRIGILALTIVAAFTSSFSQAPTWSSDVAKIVYGKCSSCHREGEIAPFPLMSYQDVSSRKASMKRVVQNRTMPPWPPASGHGTFMGARALSDADITTIAEWVDAGSPAGNLELAPKPPTFPSGSQLGTPDLVLEMSEAWHIQGNNKDVHRFFVIPTNMLQDVNIAAIEFRPGNAKVIHHVLYFQDTSGIGRQRDAADPLPGYAGTGDPGFTPASSLLGWVPGAQQRLYPPTIGARLYKNADLVIQIHYAPSETEQTDRSSVNIFFQKSPTVRQVQEFALSPRDLIEGQSFVIPANTVRTFTTYYSVPLDISLIGIAPHMHLLGQNARAYAVTPNNDTINLIKVDKWVFHWQGGYAYRNPVRIPRGSILHYTAEYDNTTDNPENPNSPPRLVTWGDNTTDEMLLCYFHWLNYQQGDENIDMETTPTSVGEGETSREFALAVYPSPSRDRAQISIETTKPEKVQIQVVDLTGRTVFTDERLFDLVSGLNVLPLNTQGLSSGQYIVRVVGRATSSSVAFIVSH